MSPPSVVIRRVAQCQHSGKCLRLVAVDVGTRKARTCRRGCPRFVDLFRLSDRWTRARALRSLEVVKQQTIQDGKDARVDTDAQCDRHDGGGRESRSPPQPAHGVTNISSRYLQRGFSRLHILQPPIEQVNDPVTVRRIGFGVGHLTQSLFPHRSGA